MMINNNIFLDGMLMLEKNQFISTNNIRNANFTLNWPTIVGQFSVKFAGKWTITHLEIIWSLFVDSTRHSAETI